MKLPEFDAMAGRHAQAADRLEELARALHHELRGAGLDTAPAARIRELAAQVAEQAEDLRRRQALIREMRQEKLPLGFSTPTGSYLRVPDRLESARALLDGSVAANAARQAAQGDLKAVERLEKYAARVNDAEFTKVFLARLGGHGLTRLPGALAAALRDARREGDPAQTSRLSRQAKRILGMLSDGLAQATDPRHPSYAGDAFLDELRKAGRAEHLIDDIRYSGYQSQALIWSAHDGKPPFSATFMRTVGQDAVAYEKELYADRWTASKELGMPHASLFDLAAVLGLGSALRPGPGTATTPGKPLTSSVIDDLLHAAGSTRESSQALLAHTPTGWTTSILTHLITTRLDAFHHSAPLTRTLISATTGQDPRSKQLAAELIKVLSGQVQGNFGTADDGSLKITNDFGLKRMEHLRYPLGSAIAAHIDQVSQLLVHHGSFHGVNAEQMSWALSLATSDDNAFEALIRAQTEHMRHSLNVVPPVGLDTSNFEKLGYMIHDLEQYDEDGDGRLGRGDVKDALVNLIVAEARPFAHIVEIRRQALIAQGLEKQETDDVLRIMVRDAVGLLPVPGAKQVSGLANGVLGSLLTKKYDEIANAGYDEISRRVAQHVSEQRWGLGETYPVLADNRIAVDKLSEQLVVTAMLSKGVFDGVPLRGQSFAVNGEEIIKPFEKMTSNEYAEFLEWAGRKGGAYDLLDRFRSTFRDASEVDDYLNLRTSSNSESLR